MRNTIYGTMLVIVLAVADTSCEGPISGGPCTPIGATRLDKAGSLWTCAENRSTGNGYWYEGRP